MRSAFMCGLAAAVAATMLGGCALKRSALGTPRERLERVSEVLPRIGAADLPSPLTIDAAVARALAVDPSVASALGNVRLAMEEAGAAHDMRDPELRLSVGDVDVDSTSTSSGTQSDVAASGLTSASASTNISSSSESETRSVLQVGVRLFPRNPWMRHARVSEAKARMYASEASVTAVGMDVARTVREHFAELQYMATDLEFLDELVELRRSLSRDMKRLVDQGQGTILDSSRAAYRYLQAMSERQRRRRERDALRSDFAAMLGILPVALPDLSAEPITDTAWQDRPPEALFEEAMGSRADLMQLGWRSRAAYEAYRQSRWSRMPWFTHVQVAYTEREDESESTSSGVEDDLLDLSSTTRAETSTDESELTGWEISTGITLPVFSWINRSDNVLKENWRQAREAEAMAVAEMQQTVRQGLSDLALQQERDETFRAETMDVMGEIEIALDQTDASGVLPPDDVARMREQILEIRRLRNDTRHQRIMSLLAVENAAGLTPLPDTGWNEL